MRVRAIYAAISIAALCLISGPAAAQWRNYDGYQVRPAYPPAYPDADYGAADPYDPYAPPPPRHRPPPSYTRAPADPYEADPYAAPERQASLPPADGSGDFDSEVGQSRTARMVPNPTQEQAGTIVIDTSSRHLYFVQGGGQAIEYGIGVGREGFAWKGNARVGRKAEWPRWIPPKEMLARRPDLPTSMNGGLENPLGARALYLFKGEKDTLFRIYGTNEPDTIGKAVSSGCIRMMNADVMDLYKRVPVGTKVVVL